LLCQISALQTALAVRLMAPAAPARPNEPTGDDRLLTAEEAAKILGVTVRWIYRHQRLPFIRKLSRKVLRVSEVALRRWLVARKT
jgi:predicted DNA-binding transcriptional regulator AlpA